MQSQPFFVLKMKFVEGYMKSYEYTQMIKSLMTSRNINLV